MGGGPGNKKQGEVTGAGPSTSTPAAPSLDASICLQDDAIVGVSRARSVARAQANARDIAMRTDRLLAQIEINRAELAMVTKSRSPPANVSPQAGTDDEPPADVPTNDGSDDDEDPGCRNDCDCGEEHSCECHTCQTADDEYIKKAKAAKAAAAAKKADAIKVKQEPEDREDRDSDDKDSSSSLDEDEAPSDQQGEYFEHDDATSYPVTGIKVEDTLDVSMESDDSTKRPKGV